MALVIRWRPRPACFEDEIVGEQQGHSPFDMYEQALVPRVREPPLGDALDGILRLGMSLQVAQDRPRQFPVCGGIRLCVQSTPPSSILALQAALRMVREESKKGAIRRRAPSPSNRQPACSSNVGGPAASGLPPLLCVIATPRPVRAYPFPCQSHRIMLRGHNAATRRSM